MKQLITRLCETYGPSGHEGQVREYIKSEIGSLADSVRVDVMGNLIAVKGPAGGAVAARRVMVAAHMDEIGLIVTHIDDDGFLRFAAIGGVHPATLVGNRVVFADGVKGVIGAEEKGSQPNEFPRLDRLFLDIGAAGKDEAGRMVAVGDVCAFDRPCVEAGQRLVAKAMDDRIGCAVLVEVLRGLKASPHEVSFVFTVQEEVGVRGAITSTYGVNPDVAIAVDITATGDVPEARTLSISLGKGPAIKVKDRGMIAHAGLKSHMFEVAKDLAIPFQPEVLELGSTDAMAMQMSRGGVPAGVVSIPTRYAHSPSEMIDMRDVSGAVNLLLGLLSRPFPF